MALSMEEQRILAEIEQRLAKSEPALAARLGVVRPPRPGERAAVAPGAGPGVVRGARGGHRRVAGRYAMLPLRALPDRASGGRATPASRQPMMTVLQPPAMQQSGRQPPVSRASPVPPYAALR